VGAFCLKRKEVIKAKSTGERVTGKGGRHVPKQEGRRVREGDWRWVVWRCFLRFGGISLETGEGKIWGVRGKSAEELGGLGLT